MNELRVPKHGPEGKDQEWEALRKEYTQLRLGHRRAQEENGRLKRCLYGLTMLLQEAGIRPDPPASDLDLASVDLRRSFDRCEATPPHLRDLALGDHARTPADDKFVLASDIAIHSGPVYTSSFSPCGVLLASGAGDCCISLYHFALSQVAHVLAGHQAAVSDLSWAQDSRSLLSVALERGDSSAILWDVPGAQVRSTFSGMGACMLAVEFSPADPHQFLACDSKDHVLVFDTRQPAVAATVCNGCMVYALDVGCGGDYFVTGDQRGQVKFWDLRRSDVSSGGVPAVFHHFANGQEAAPLSYVHLANFGPGNVDNGRYLAVNSYDNVLRVYDRGSLINTGTLTFRVRHQLYGHKNKNHTIKSSFYCGPQYGRQGQPPKKVESLDDSRARGLERSFLLATGSSDGFAYVYDISSADGVSNRLLQKLGAHKDVVYGVTFHPHLPVLVSHSKDSTIKVWAPVTPKAV
eukprot:GGOE01061983.1.p1 GENE.GGOE01061983.1~~GGOE01061983.1.p1  ORF type:complete len:490 (+),score=157.57 GGOE01061983.1:80-1471(+)